MNYKTCPAHSVSHDEVMKRKLKSDSMFAVEYLRAALEDADEPKVLLIALRRITEARGGFAKVAKIAGIERESLHRALSARGNPRLSTLQAVTKAIGLKLTVEQRSSAMGRKFTHSNSRGSASRKAVSPTFAQLV